MFIWGCPDELVRLTRRYFSVSQAFSRKMFEFQAKSKSTTLFDLGQRLEIGFITSGAKSAKIAESRSNRKIAVWFKNQKWLIQIRLQNCSLIQARVCKIAQLLPILLKPT